MKYLYSGLSAVLVLGSQVALADTAKPNQAAIVGAEISTIAGHLAEHPNTAIDFSKVSGEYCFDTGLGGGGHMTHYAIDPRSTQEDVIDFVNAESLIKSGAVKADSLPKFPGKLGEMKPNQWYYLAANELEPHHGKKFPFALLMKASNHK